MAVFDNKTSLLRLGPLLDLSFSHICVATFDYHQTSVFPVNILLALTRDEGKGDEFITIPSEGRREPLLADHVYFVPCELEVRFDISPAITTLAFHFNLTFLHGLDVFSGAKNWEMRRDPALAARLAALANETKDELKAVCALKAEVMNFCLSRWPEGLDRLTPAARQYEPLFRHVREHGDAAFSVGDLAALAGRRQDVFSRAFSRDIGKSPQEFLHNDLLKKIAARLLLPGASVKEVADWLKFSSEFYLSRFFKKRTGISPREYQAKFRR